MTKTTQPAATTPETAAPLELSHMQPPWHVIVLTVLTFFGYSLIWIWRNLDQLKGFANSAYDAEQLEQSTTPEARAALRFFARQKPILYTLGLIVPGLQIALLLIFYRNIARLSPRRGALLNNSWFTGVTLTAATVGILCLAELPGWKMLLFLHTALPLALAQVFINKFWRAVERPGLMTRQAFSGGELIAIILGSIWLGLLIFHFTQ